MVTSQWQLTAEHEITILPVLTGGEAAGASAHELCDREAQERSGGGRGELRAREDLPERPDPTVNCKSFAVQNLHLNSYISIPSVVQLL